MVGLQRPVITLVLSGVFLLQSSASGADGIIHGDKGVSVPSGAMAARWRERMHALEEQRSTKPVEGRRLATDPRLAALSGSQRALIILAEFGSDTITFYPDGENRSTWDPIGTPDGSEWTGTVGDCSVIIQNHNINGPTEFTYSGPLHNRIERPLSADDASGKLIWQEDFNPAYYRELAFGGGVLYDYARQDGTLLTRDLRGFSVKEYYDDMSGGRLTLDGDVVGWVRLPHSMFWYGADPCPGRRSDSTSTSDSGAIPGAGNKKQFVRDAIDAVKAAYPNLDWSRYDGDGDGVIDTLWVVHAGLGEEDSKALLGRTDYGEGSLWSSASSLDPRHPAGEGVSVGSVTVLPENAGAAVLAHEFGHNLGAIDLYPDGEGDDAAGFWTLMSDTWIGHPVGSGLNAFDPYHLEMWGWFEPYVVSDPGREYTVRVGQASGFPGGGDVYRGVKIELPDQTVPRRVAPMGNFYWWGGASSPTNSMMTTKAPITLPAAGPITLDFQAAWDIEQGWDFLWVQISADNGQTWRTLTNADTVCQHASSWIGQENGFPADLCGMGIGGYSGMSPGYPSLAAQSFDLSGFAGMQVLLRFWYMTDEYTLGTGFFVDDVRIGAGQQTLLADGGETGDGNWDYTEEWSRVTGYSSHTHNYYLQWRNTTATGGFDSALGDSDWRFGPANTGLLVWYNNNNYLDNDISKYLNDYPSFGPKGIMLPADAHPEPYRDPNKMAQGYENEGANIIHRSQMRDAPFSIAPTVPFLMKKYWFADEDTQFPSRPGVRRFSDALGYYPGAKYVELGPAYQPRTFAWVSEQWDASMVVPSSAAYGIRAPGFRASDWFLYNCSASGGELVCDPLNGIEKPSADGGSGNPGNVNGQYGWHVEILEQSNTQATLRIWNDKNVDMPPVVRLVAPLTGESVSGAVQVTAAATDDLSLSSVDFYVDAQLQRTVTAAPYVWQWNTASSANGRRRVAARACDSAGQCTSADATIDVANTSAPSVVITSPVGATTVSGVVRVEATVTGNASMVEFRVDGRIASSMTVAPWVLNWKTSETGAGYHTLTARACDAQSRCGEASVTVYVSAAAGAPVAAAFTNGASYRTGSLAPDEIVTLWGSNMASGFVQANTNPPPTELAGTSITFTDSAGVERAGQLFYVSGGQTGLTVPAGTALGLATAKVTGPAGVTTYDVLIEAVAPGLFTINQDGRGVPAGLAWRASDGTWKYLFDSSGPVGIRQPAPIRMDGGALQVYLLLYGTGIRHHTSVKALVGGIEVPAVAVAQSEYVGLDQINVGPLPGTLAGRGEVEVVLTIDGVEANRVTVNLGP